MVRKLYLLEWERLKVEEADGFRTLSTEMGFQVLSGLWRR